MRLTFTPQHGWRYVLAESCTLEVCWDAAHLNVTAATQEQTETSLFCHAQISVIMCNYHHCRFSGRCKGVRKGLVEEFSVFEVCDRLTRFTLKPEQVRTHPTPKTRSVCPILMSLSAQEQWEKKTVFQEPSAGAAVWKQTKRWTLCAPPEHKQECICTAFMLSFVRCNAWVSLKRRKSSQGKCLLIRFRYCFIAVSSLTSSLTVPLHTQGSLHLQEFLRLKYQNSAKQLVSPHQKTDAVVWLMSLVEEKIYSAMVQLLD